MIREVGDRKKIEQGCRLFYADVGIAI